MHPSPYTKKNTFPSPPPNPLFAMNSGGLSTRTMSSSHTTNGRVDIITPRMEDLFQMYDKIPAKQCVTLRNPTEGLWQNTELSDMFFSGKNICYLQQAIRQGVYQQSNQQFMIGNQDEDTLLIIMRSTFLQHSTNQPTHLSKQLQKLNQLVIDYCVPQVFGEAQGYMQYLKDASTLYEPLPPPMMSNYKDKELVMKPWF